MSGPMSSVQRWSGLAQKYGPQYGVPANVLLGLIQVESGGRTGLTSPAGAQGLTQFMPGTAKQYGVRIGDPASEVRGAARYLHDLGYSKDPIHALGSYNGGPGNPQPSYAHSVLGAAGLYKGSGTGQSYTPPASPAAPSALPAPQTSAGLGDLLARPTGVVTAPAAPAFSAKVATPSAYQAPPGVQTSARPDLTSLLSAPAAIPLPTAPAPAAPTNGLAGGIPKFSSGGLTGKPGKIIGTPFAGTHAIAFNQAGGSDNWQSERAIDIALPVGTPVYAVADGRLGNTGSLGMGGRFAGLRTNLVGANNSWYYAHLSKLGPGIRAGAQVKKGQLLGYSGEANGVAHLHFAVQRGNPASYAKQR